MNREIARNVADAVLYEGYMLYPYRRSAIKNRQRWSFGILYPPDYPEVQSGTERSFMHSECLLETQGQAGVQIELRFLQLASHEPRPPLVKDRPESLAAEIPSEGWDEGVERAVEFEINLDRQHEEVSFRFPVSCDGNFDNAANGAGSGSIPPMLSGTVSTFTEEIREGVLKLSIDARNTTPLGGESIDRDSALHHSLLSAHLILSATCASFVSLLDPPTSLAEAAKACANIGNFPVLVGEPGERGMLLCSPIILYDYPQIAPESARDFYDSTEMDEMLTLRVLTLTEEEKRQAKSGDLRVRELVERTEQSAREQLMRTHGAMRNLRPGMRPGE